MAENKNGKSGAKSSGKSASGAKKTGGKKSYKPRWGVRIAIVLVVGVLLGESLRRTRLSAKTRGKSGFRRERSRLCRGTLCT